ncbi:hypothetical protein AB1Y20_017060 [Prymnesium parvum]|uniref:Aminoacyl-transfer RNA synthetases class-II family profile domain-containing protein n=1 Tax=Prymnesium parvum TaxID=97485 RepID=A0AB34I8E6_PRYPA
MRHAPSPFSTCRALRASPLGCPTTAELIAARLGKAELLRQAGKRAFEYSYERTHTPAALVAQFAALAPGEVDDDADIAVCGRLLARRIFGKLAFFTLQDSTGTVQLYLEKRRLAEAFKPFLAATDAGHIVGVRGSVKRSAARALAPWAPELLLPLSFTHPSAQLSAHPNPLVRATFAARAKITSFIRRFLDERGFLEIEPPSLHAVAGGAEAKPFETYHNALGLPLTLRIATELHLKRLIVGGFDRVYELGRIFRNEGISTRHNPEFTSIELYPAYCDYTAMMELTEELIVGAAAEIGKGSVLENQGQQVDLTTPWRRASMHELFPPPCSLVLVELLSPRGILLVKWRPQLLILLSYGVDLIEATIGTSL